MERAFRYQTGEVKDIVKDLRKDGRVEVDVMDSGRIKPFLKDLEQYGVFEDTEADWDYEAISFFDDQEFLCRVYVKDAKSSSDCKLYIDFYTDYEEDSYDTIFFG